jgi:hypothetical protein
MLIISMQFEIKFIVVISFDGDMNESFYFEVGKKSNKNMSNRFVLETQSKVEIKLL